jgi:hypothetical protein
MMREPEESDSAAAAATPKNKIGVVCRGAGGANDGSQRKRGATKHARRRAGKACHALAALKGRRALFGRAPSTDPAQVSRFPLAQGLRVSFILNYAGVRKAWSQSGREIRRHLPSKAPRGLFLAIHSCT